MDYKLRIVVEKVEVKTNKIINKSRIAEYRIEKPAKINDLGLSHKTQIELLKKIQQQVLDEQTLTIETDTDTCPQCGNLLRKNGYKKAVFHAIFSDHQLNIQRHHCPSCHYNSVPSIKSLFGTSIHPDLYKLQCELGAAFSFFKSECQLAHLCQEKREINNHQRIKKTVNAVGEALFNITTKTVKSKAPASSLIVQIDGGHIKDKQPDKRSFEALSAKVYRPEAVIISKKGRTKITDKTCVASAKADQLKAIKQLIESAAKKQGMTKQTSITVLADGAKNCWQAVSVLSKHCDKIEFILDWFHIAKLVQPLINSLKSEDQARIETIKWNLWHGKQAEAFRQLSEAMNHFADKEIVTKLKKINTYLKQNRNYLCYYAERKQRGLLFTSHVAESTVEHLINERHKRKQKMQWTRESAHHVLQIRAAMASNDWCYLWPSAVEAAIQATA